ALMSGALTKFVPVLLVPLAAAAIWRDRVPARRRGKVPAAGEGPTPERQSLSTTEVLSTLAIGGVVAAGLALALYAPFWQGPQTVGALGRQSLLTASLPKITLDVLQQDLHIAQGTAQSLVRYAALALVALVTLFHAVRIFLVGNVYARETREVLVRRTLAGFYEVLFFYFVFGTLWFQPWYLIWLVALTAPVGRYVNANRTVLFCIGGIANYFVWDFLWLWNRADVRNIQIASAIVIYTAPLFYSVYIWLRPLWEKRDELRITNYEL
ncbi:MAG: hypothetical protein M3328_10020, partial [Chloroflexota bacterium]|nr:hypothetical protein [Chloroflexota bacterium]